MARYAVIEESGGQRKVISDELILIDLYKGGLADAGESITFDKVLLVGDTDADASGKASVGLPYVKGATVTAEVVEPVTQGEKLYIHKFRAKKGYRRKTGHRQSYTTVKITGITG
jgi:large subunit ribosomal protein L21